MTTEWMQISCTCIAMHRRWSGV